jgi:PPOX class probable F420-dependent enzyme
MLTIDRGTRLGASAAAHLDGNVAVWLTTVDPTGTPQPTPVWFLWTGEEVLMFSRPRTAKLRNIAKNPGIALHFDGNGRGGDVVVLTGQAEVTEVSELELGAFDQKYAADIRRIGMTPESFHADYSVPIRFRPAKLRGI